MQVLHALSREHRVFKKLIQLLERCLLKGSPEAGRRHVGEVLDVLLPALEAHEEIEESVLGTAAYATEKKARSGLESAALDHKALEASCAAMSKAVRGSGGPSSREFALLVRSFSRTLRAHFLAEERRLWPHFKRSWAKISPPRHDFLAHCIGERIDGLEKGVLRLEKSAAGMCHV